MMHCACLLMWKTFTDGNIIRFAFCSRWRASVWICVCVCVYINVCCMHQHIGTRWPPPHYIDTWNTEPMPATACSHRNGPTFCPLVFVIVLCPHRVIIGKVDGRLNKFHTTRKIDNDSIKFNWWSWVERERERRVRVCVRVSSFGSVSSALGRVWSAVWCMRCGYVALPWIGLPPIPLLTLHDSAMESWKLFRNFWMNG